MNAGVTTLDENPNAQTTEKAYIGDRSSTKRVKSYSTQFPFSTELIVEETAVMFIYDIARNHKTGSEAETDYIRVELWKPITGKENTFAARKFRVSVEVSSIAGAGTEELVQGGNLNGIGDFIDGEFSTTTRTFTAKGETTETP